MSSLLYDDSNVKNKTDKAYLEFKLRVLDLENKFDKKMRQSNRLKFRQKYGLNEDIFGPDMKQTCISSFLGEKDERGKQRESDTSVSAAEIYDYQALMELLFTDGELDTEKLMCLHTLAFHPFKSHKPRASCNIARDLQDSAALDKLVERSRLKRGYRNGATNFLPIYVLNLNHKMNNSSKPDDEKWYSNEGRPAIRIANNENIILLISTIIDALKSSNPTKMKYFLNLVQNPLLIINILNKPEHQDFLNSLSDLSVIVSSNSFCLCKPYVHHVTLIIQEPLQSLQNLIKRIRTGVLYYSTVLDEQIGSKDCKNTYQMTSKRNSLSLVEEDIINADKDSFLSMISYKTKKFNATHVSRIITNKVREAFKRDMKELKKSTMQNELNKEVFSTSKNAPVSKLLDAKEVKSEIKLLETKRKSEKQLSIYKSLSKKPIKDTDSNISDFQAKFNKNAQWLNRMIKQEEENMYHPMIQIDKTQRKFIKQPKTKKPMTLSKEKRNPIYLQKKTKKYFDSLGYKPIETQNILNNINLAKLKHEVSVIENKRRVKHFLEAPLFQKNSADVLYNKF